MRAQDVINDCRMLAGDDFGDIHTDAKMIAHLNRVCRDISAKSRTITEAYYREARPYQSQYGLPEGFLRCDIAAWKTVGGPYRVLSPIRMKIASWGTHNGITGIPKYYDIYGRAAIERVSQERVARINVEAPPKGTLDVITLTGNQTLVLKRGDKIVNVNDNSAVGFVTFTKNGLTNNNEIEQYIGYSELEDGSRRQLYVGDQIRILSPDTSQHNLIVAPVPVETGELGHEALFLYIARLHRVITHQHIVDENDYLELDPEFEEALREYIIYYMMRTESEISDSDAQSQYIIANTAYARALPKVQRRIRDWINTWHKRGGLGEIPTLHPLTGTQYNTYTFGVGANEREEEQPTQPSGPLTPVTPSGPLSVSFAQSDGGGGGRSLTWEVVFHNFPRNKQGQINKDDFEMVGDGSWWILPLTALEQRGATTFVAVVHAFEQSGNAISGTVSLKIKRDALVGDTLTGNDTSAPVTFNFDAGSTDIPQPTVPVQRQPGAAFDEPRRFPARNDTDWGDQDWGDFNWGI